jgi:hypothetical protein
MSLTVAEPRHVTVTGDNAYVVVPASMTFKVDGKQVMQTGATFTLALRKLSDGWRIAGLGVGKTWSIARSAVRQMFASGQGLLRAIL